MSSIRVTGLVFLIGAGMMAAQTIDNAFLRVELRNRDVSLFSRASGRQVISQLVFPGAVEHSGLTVTDDPVWGSGEALELTHSSGHRTMLVLYPESPFVHVHTTVVNEDDKALEFNQFDFLTLDMVSGWKADGLRFLGTGGLAPVSEGEGSYAFGVVADPETRNGIVCGWLTHEQATGLFFPESGKDSVTVDAGLEFGQMRVEPGESRGTEVLLVGYFEDARLGLEKYADSIAKHYGIELGPMPGVYCTWYHAGASNEDAVAENTAFAAKNLEPYGLGVMQIDDRWQALLPEGFRHEGKIRTTGPVKVFVDTKPNFSKGMEHTAKQISSRGMVPGIWFMPFAGNFRNPYFDSEIFARNPDGTPFHDGRWSGTCIDSTSPKGEQFIRERVRRIYDWGYRYFKIDGMHTGLATYNIYVNTSYRNKDFGLVKLHDPEMTQVQAYRKCLKILREEAPEAFVLGCNVSQNMRSMGPAFGMIDAMRIGPDNGGAGRGKWGAVTKGAWHGTNLYFLNGRVWYNDPDPVYTRDRNPLEYAQWMCSWMALSGAMHTSSEQYSELPPERLDILKRCLPSHTCRTRPVDLFETNNPRIWLAQDTRLNVIGLFNWNKDAPEEIVYDMEKLGLKTDGEYAAFDFWADRFIEPFSGTLRQPLPGGTCRVLAVREMADHPQLLSTSRHITQGLTDVLEETWGPETNTLTGKSRVVASDRYELRISLPPDRNFRLMSAHAGDTVMKAGEADDLGIRVSVIPRNSGVIGWTLKFRKIDD